MLPIIYSQELSALLMCKINVGCRVESPFWIQTNSMSNILPTKQASLVLFFFLLKGWLNLPRSGKKHYLVKHVKCKFLNLFCPFRSAASY